MFPPARVHHRCSPSWTLAGMSLGPEEAGGGIRRFETRKHHISEIRRRVDEQTGMETETNNGRWEFVRHSDSEELRRPKYRDEERKVGYLHDTVQPYELS